MIQALGMGAVVVALFVFTVFGGISLVAAWFSAVEKRWPYFWVWFTIGIALIWLAASAAFYLDGLTK